MWTSCNPMSKCSPFGVRLEQGLYKIDQENNLVGKNAEKCIGCSECASKFWPRVFARKMRGKDLNGVVYIHEYDLPNEEQKNNLLVSSVHTSIGMTWSFD